MDRLREERTETLDPIHIKSVLPDVGWIDLEKKGLKRLCTGRNVHGQFPPVGWIDLEKKGLKPLAPSGSDDPDHSLGWMDRLREERTERRGRAELLVRIGQLECVEERLQKGIMTRQALMATAAVVVGILILFLVGKWVFYPGPREAPDLGSRQEEPRPQTQELTTPPPESPSGSAEITQEQEKPAKPSAKISPSKSQASQRAQRQAKVSGRPFVRRPAEPGIYQTIRRTSVRTRPNNSASVLDELGSNARLHVLGSEGDWLIVRSNKLKTVVYVKRDDAMFLPGEKPATEFSEVEARWKKIESEIYKSFSRWGVRGVTVSFIGDTAYLIGDVKTEDERFRAEQAARTIPQVERIYNGVWVNP